VRRLVTVVVVAAMMMGLSGCGRQVTGLNAGAGGGIVPTGQTAVRFDTVGPLDFQNVSYLIVLNTSGNGQQPYALGYNTDFKNWSAFFIVGGGAGYANFPGLLQVYQDPASGASRTFNVPIPTGTVSFLPTVPTGNGFQITFNRCLVDLAPPTASPPPPVSSQKNCPPYANINKTWQISLFTLDRTQSPVDSLSSGGASNTDYKFPGNGLDTSQTVTTLNFFKPANQQVSNPSAQIAGVEVFSTP
jgi:hypothetical protein